MEIRLEDFRPYGRCGTYYAETGKDHLFGPPEDSPDAYHNITSPKLRETARRRDRERAKALCAVCPVRTACLRWALQENEPGGIWGGLTQDERTTLKNKTAATAA